jgi:hypothetical protein
VSGNTRTLELGDALRDVCRTRVSRIVLPRQVGALGVPPATPLGEAQAHVAEEESTRPCRGFGRGKLVSQGAVAPEPPGSPLEWLASLEAPCLAHLVDRGGVPSVGARGTRWCREAGGAVRAWWRGCAGPVAGLIAGSALGRSVLLQAGKPMRAAGGLHFHRRGCATDWLSAQGPEVASIPRDGERREGRSTR